jgi:pimeloyl-ACP methyl ester carboxylesterase
MPEVELSAGTIECEETGGPGPVVVLLHGLLMNGTLWRRVVPGLSEYRCVLPTLPLGGHSRPMRPDADLSLPGQARLVAELLERLDLRDVTLVFNDWGAAQVLIAEGLDGRIAKLVLSSCEAFDNYPPGLPGKSLVRAAALPGGLNLAVQQLRLRPLRRLPMTFGRMAKRPIPHEVTDAWLRPAMTQRAIRRDLRKYLRSVPPRDQLLEWAEQQRTFDRPVLVAWATDDRVMPHEHGRRLADLFPNARLVEIADSYTLIPEDQPAELAAHLRAFLSDRTINSRKESTGRTALGESREPAEGSPDE